MKTINSETFDSDLHEAIRDPESHTAKRLLNKLLPNIKMGATRILFGPMERQDSKYKLYDNVQHFGLPNWFLTITPNEIHGPLYIRLCTTKEYKTPHEIELLSAESRALITSKNSAAAAQLFISVINMALRHLLQIEMSSSSKTMISMCSI